MSARDIISDIIDEIVQQIIRGDFTPPGTWILETGFWNDGGVWDDSDMWND